MSAPLRGVARDQRAYHVHMALMAAENAERDLRRGAHQLLDDVIDQRAGSMGLFRLSVHTATVREWSGIARACRREDRRLAKLKHGGAL